MSMNSDMVWCMSMDDSDIKMNCRVADAQFVIVTSISAIILRIEFANFDDNSQEKVLCPDS